MDWLITRATHRSVALETTLLCHGVPRERATELAAGMNDAIRAHGADPAVVGVLDGRAVVGMTDEELARLVSLDPPKLNTSNLAMALSAGGAGATTVSATLECAAAAGVRVFATGGLGGVHRGPFDVSADLVALTRFPVAVVCSGVKSMLDIGATREALETLGVSVIGFRTDDFPAFYTRTSGSRVDWRIDDVRDLAGVISSELERTGRGIIIANPIPATHEIDRDELDRWVQEAETGLANVPPRDRTPHVLAHLHACSDGRTLEANVALVLANADLAGAIASTWA